MGKTSWAVPFQGMCAGWRESSSEGRTAREVHNGDPLEQTDLPPSCGCARRGCGRGGRFEGGLVARCEGQTWRNRGETARRGEKEGNVHRCISSTVLEYGNGMPVQLHTTTGWTHVRCIRFASCLVSALLILKFVRAIHWRAYCVVGCWALFSMRFLSAGYCLVINGAGRMYSAGRDASTLTFEYLHVADIGFSER